MVIIIGAGAAGLNCARLLHMAGVDFWLLEASDGIGGRMRTDEVDGYRLDRGFQVLQTAYPEARSALEFDRLELVELVPGARIRKHDRWITMSDPWRRPSQLFATLFNSIGSFSDRLKLWRLKRDCGRGDVQAMLARRDDCSTLELLRDRYHFSPDFIECFMRPWLAGIFLESELSTSANFFRFVFRMLSDASICYPAAGIAAIPQQLAAGLPGDRIRLQARVSSIEPGTVTLESGERIDGQAIVLAADVNTAAQLASNCVQPAQHNATRCIYFAAERAPIAEPVLLLAGDGGGPSNHVFVMSNASAVVAPEGKALISVSQVGAAARAAYDASATRRQLQSWFGTEVDEWRELREYVIPHALPQQLPGYFSSDARLPPKQPGHVFICGDYCESVSLNGALRSGRLAAEAVIAQLR